MTLVSTQAKPHRPHGFGPYAGERSSSTSLLNPLHFARCVRMRTLLRKVSGQALTTPGCAGQGHSITTLDTSARNEAVAALLRPDCVRQRMKPLPSRVCFVKYSPISRDRIAA
jgi:hypothetical protein